MGRSSATGVPLLGYARTAGLPSVSVERWAGRDRRRRAPVTGTHAHDFLVLLYVQDGETERGDAERGGDVLHVDGQDWRLRTGDAFVMAPGAVVAAREHHGDSVDEDDDGVTWAVLFPADAIDPSAAAPLASWHTHPLLAPFIGRHRGGGQRLHIPVEERDAWLTHLTDLDAELRGRRDGYADAAMAHLTLLLVALSRLQVDVPGEPAVEPLLAAVLDVIERRYAEPISLRDVADAVGLTPGHLTTAVGRRTGRTVQQWLTERRMREARRLLTDTDLTVAEIAHRVGHRDAGYFIRRFRTAHGVTPSAWRRAGRSPV